MIDTGTNACTEQAVCHVVHAINMDLPVQGNSKFLEAEHIQALAANQDLQVRTASPDPPGGTLPMQHSIVIKIMKCRTIYNAVKLGLTLFPAQGNPIHLNQCQKAQSFFVCSLPGWQSVQRLFGYEPFPGPGMTGAGDLQSWMYALQTAEPNTY